MSAEDEIAQAKKELIAGFMPADYRGRAATQPLMKTVRHAIEHHKWHHDMEEGKDAVRLRNDIIDMCAAVAPPGVAEKIRDLKGRDTASTWDRLIDDDVLEAVLKEFGKPEEIRLSLRIAFAQARDYLKSGGHDGTISEDPTSAPASRNP